MLDLNSELNIVQLIPLQAGSGTITGTGVLVNGLNTGDLDMASLNLIGGSSFGSVTVQLQSSQSLSTGYTNIAPTALMPNTAFPAVTAALTAPATLPIDPRAIGPYIRAVATAAGGVTGFDMEVVLYSRLAQQGFGTTSG